MESTQKALVIARSDWPDLRKPQSVRAALSDRLTLSEAIRVVAEMLRGYPNGNTASDSYIGALAEVLGHYPRCVAARAGKVFNGVPSTTKFLPTPADIIAWCEREKADLQGIVDREDRDARIIEAVRALSTEAAQWDEKRKSRPTLAELKSMHGENWGIQQDRAEAIAQAKNLELGQRANAVLLRREWGNGAPPESSPGVPMSRALVDLLAGRKAEDEATG